MNIGQEPCIVGSPLSEDCHLTLFTYRRYGFLQVEDLDSDSKQLIEFRCGLVFDSDARICLHHEQRYLKKFGISKQTGIDPTKCSNPFHIANHKSSVSGRKNLTVYIALKAKSCSIKLA